MMLTALDLSSPRRQQSYGYGSSSVGVIGLAEGGYTGDSIPYRLQYTLKMLMTGKNFSPPETNSCLHHMTLSTFSSEPR
jgi:hypothetical protein